MVLLSGAPISQKEGPTATAAVLAIFAVAAVALPLVFPLFCAPFAFLGALARHPFVALAVKVCRGAGFGETYRVSAYATGLSQLASLAGSFVPIIGPLLALSLAVYVSGLGIKGAHGTNARTVVSIVLPTMPYNNTLRGVAYPRHEGTPLTPSLSSG